MEPVAQKVLRAIGQPLNLGDGKEIVVTPSIGISLFPGDGDGLDSSRSDSGDCGGD